MYFVHGSNDTLGLHRSGVITSLLFISSIIVFIEIKRIENGLTTSYRKVEWDLGVFIKTLPQRVHEIRQGGSTMTIINRRLFVTLECVACTKKSKNKYWVRRSWDETIPWID